MRFPQLFYFTFFYQDRVFARDGLLFAICSPIIVSLGIVSNGNWGTTVREKFGYTPLHLPRIWTQGRGVRASRMRERGASESGGAHASVEGLGF